MLLFFPCPESFTRLGHFLNSEMTVTNFDKGISKAAPAAVHQATWSHPCLTSNQNISCIHPLHQSQWTELNSSSYFLCQLCLPFQFVHTIHAAPTYRYIACCTDTMWGYFTSCRKAFLNPVMSVGAKSLPGTQLTTTGNPLGQVPLDFSSTAWPSLQLDKCASLPVQLTE